MAYLDDHPPASQQFRCPRRERPSGVIGVHTTESHPDEQGADTGAEGVASFIQRRSGYGSYHYLVDSDSIIQMVRLGCVAYHIATHGINEHSIGISAATMAHQWDEVSDEWAEAVVLNMAKVAARAARWAKREYGITIPAKRITASQAANREPGFVAHGDADPARRTDPGKDFPWGMFLGFYADLMGGTIPDAGGTMSWDDRSIDYVNKSKSTARHQLAKAHEYSHGQPGRVWSRRWPWRGWIKKRWPDLQKRYPKGYTMQALLQNLFGYVRDIRAKIGSFKWLRDTLGRAVWSRRSGGDGDMHATVLQEARAAARKAAAGTEANNKLLAQLIDRDPGNPLTEERVSELFHEAIEDALVSVEVDVSANDSTDNEPDEAVEDEDQPESEDPAEAEEDSE